MDGYLYENKFVAFPNSIPFRANEPIPKPKIYGNQTAIVTVKEGEEIWCDDARRIKVKFHWDRAQEKDENSSCWIRVAQIWSGSTWGGLFTPRKDMEVVVTFLDGDPDRPLIVGCVYNGDNKPPYDNNDATKNGIKSRSSKEDEGFNELRFEDKKGEEEVYIHAQKDMNEYIIHSQTTTLQTGSRTVKILAEKDDDGDDTLEMTRGTKLIHITEGDFNTNLDKGNQSTTLTQGDQTTTLSQGNREITLSQGNQTVTLSSGHYTLTLSSGNLTIDITGSVTVKSTQDMAFESSTGKMSFKALSGFDFSTSAGDFNVSHCLNFKAKADIAAEVQSSVTAKLQSAIVQIKADALADINGGAIVKAGPMVKIG